ncbi:MAG: hypothetical protein M1840_005558 [Geoglossum simile]|nr:MAG: hypothetical protein M1840_005558 [Geoglossum simile]
MWEEILSNRRKKISGKRMALKGHFVLTMEEILNEVRKAEAETMGRKTRVKTGTSQRSRKHKRPETPSEDEKDSSSDDGSNTSDCIVVGNS